MEGEPIRVTGKMITLAVLTFLGVTLPSIMLGYHSGHAIGLLDQRIACLEERVAE